MKIINRYIITPKTAAIIPKYDENGNVYSLVIEESQIIHVQRSPKWIINDSLRHFGSNLAGACSGTKYLLGITKMNPVVLSSQLKMYWYPCKSPESKEFIWIAHSHMLAAEKITQKNTNVHLSYGHIITVAMSKKSFDEKYNQTTKLMNIISENNHFPDNANCESVSEFLICKDPKDNNILH